jgi:hypothetical protein
MHLSVTSDHKTSNFSFSYSHRALKPFCAFVEHVRFLPVLAFGRLARRALGREPFYLQQHRTFNMTPYPSAAHQNRTPKAELSHTPAILFRKKRRFFA